MDTVTVVLKFGGSSVADNIKLNLVADRIKDLTNKELLQLFLHKERQQII